MNSQTKFSKIARFHRGYASDFLSKKDSSKNSFLQSNIKGLFFLFFLIVFIKVGEMSFQRSFRN